MRMVRQFSDPPKPFRGKAERRLLHIGEHKPGRKRAANVSIDEDILAAAKAMNINLSQTLEEELRRRVQPSAMRNGAAKTGRRSNRTIASSKSTACSWKNFRIGMSRQFDVFPNPSRTGREGRPFVVDVQSNRFHDVRTRAIIPLIVTSDVEETPRLTPSFVINGRRLYLQPLEIGILPARLLRNPVANLESERYRIIAAIDLVFTGI